MTRRRLVGWLGFGLIAVCEGSTFTGWTGPCWGLEPCTVTMS